MQCNVEPRVAVARIHVGQVGKVNRGQLLVAVKSLADDGIELIVVPNAYVITEFQAAAVFFEEGVIGFGHECVVNSVAAFLVYLLYRAVLVGQSIPGAIIIPARFGCSTLVGEETFVGCPRLIESEVVLARRIDDNLEHRGVDTGKGVAAGQNKALRAHGLCAVLIGLQAQVEGVYRCACKD